MPTPSSNTSIREEWKKTVMSEVLIDMGQTLMEEDILDFFLSKKEEWMNEAREDERRELRAKMELFIKGMIDAVSIYNNPSSRSCVEMADQILKGVILLSTKEEK